MIRFSLSHLQTCIYPVQAISIKNLQNQIHMTSKNMAQTTLVRDFMKMYRAAQLRPYKWTGSKSDLYEMAYRAYLSEALVDTSGVPLTFTEVCRRMALCFQTPCPRNIYAFAIRACNRHGIRCRSVLSRYEFRMDSTQQAGIGS